MKTVHPVFLVLFLALLCVAMPAAATSYSTDQSDLWWANPPGSESGWGIQLVQRNATVFATMFVYGPTGAPTWYVATMTPIVSGGVVWSGNLYSTTGPYFATVPFNPADVVATLVGTMTWAEQSVTTGTLNYVVDGTPVSKTLTRETLVVDDFTGFYIGGVHEMVTACANPALNGTFDLAGTVDFVQLGTTANIEVVAAGNPCTYSPSTLSQSGQMGAVQTTGFTCKDGSAGTVSLTELQVTRNGFTGAFSASYSSPSGCQATGSLGGFRGIPF